MKWPDFIIIGAHKCGTTQLFPRFEKANNKLFEFLGYEIKEWKDNGR
jgi:hypothetical protein